MSNNFHPTKAIASATLFPLVKGHDRIDIPAGTKVLANWTLQPQVGVVVVKLEDDSLWLAKRADFERARETFNGSELLEDWWRTTKHGAHTYPGSHEFIGATKTVPKGTGVRTAAPPPPPSAPVSKAAPAAVQAVPQAHSVAAPAASTSASRAIQTAENRPLPKVVNSKTVADIAREKQKQKQELLKREKTQTAKASDAALNIAKEKTAAAGKSAVNAGQRAVAAGKRLQGKKPKKLGKAVKGKISQRAIDVGNKAVAAGQKIAGATKSGIVAKITRMFGDGDGMAQAQPAPTPKTPPAPTMTSADWHSQQAAAEVLSAQAAIIADFSDLVGKMIDASQTLADSDPLVMEGEGLIGPMSQAVYGPDFGDPEFAGVFADFKTKAQEWITRAATAAGNAVKNSDGSTTVTNTDGSTDTTYLDGTVVHTNLDGTSTTQKPDGSIVQGGGKPAITGISASSGVPGDIITLTGTGLDTVTAVDLNGAQVNFSPDAPTQLSFMIPDGARSGVLKLTSPGGVATTMFQVTTVPVDPYAQQGFDPGSYGGGGGGGGGGSSGDELFDEAEESPVAQFRQGVDPFADDDGGYGDSGMATGDESPMEVETMDPNSVADPEDAVQQFRQGGVDPFADEEESGEGAYVEMPYEGYAASPAYAPAPIPHSTTVPLRAIPQSAPVAAAPAMPPAEKSKVVEVLKQILSFLSPVRTEKIEGWDAGSWLHNWEGLIDDHRKYGETQTSFRPVDTGKASPDVAAQLAAAQQRAAAAKAALSAATAAQQSGTTFTPYTPTRSGSFADLLSQSRASISQGGPMSQSAYENLYGDDFDPSDPSRPPGDQPDGADELITQLMSPFSDHRKYGEWQTSFRPVDTGRVSPEIAAQLAESQQRAATAKAALAAAKAAHVQQARGQSAHADLAWKLSQALKKANEAKARATAVQGDDDRGEIPLHDPEDIIIDSYEYQITDAEPDPVRKRGSVHRGASYLDPYYPPYGASSGQEGGLITPFDEKLVIGKDKGEAKMESRHDRGLNVLGAGLVHAPAKTLRLTSGVKKPVVPRASFALKKTPAGNQHTSLVLHKPKHGDDKSSIKNAHDAANRAVSAGNKLMTAAKKAEKAMKAAPKPKAKPAPKTKVKGDTTFFGAVAAGLKRGAARLVGKKPRVRLSPAQLKKVAQNAIDAGKKLKKDADKHQSLVNTFVKRQKAMKSPKTFLRGDDFDTRAAAVDMLGAHIDTLLGLAPPDPNDPGWLTDGSIDPNYASGGAGAYTTSPPDMSNPGYLMDGSIDPSYYGTNSASSDAYPGPPDYGFGPPPTLADAQNQRKADAVPDPGAATDQINYSSDASKVPGAPLPVGFVLCDWSRGTPDEAVGSWKRFYGNREGYDLRMTDWKGGAITHEPGWMRYGEGGGSMDTIEDNEAHAGGTGGLSYVQQIQKASLTRGYGPLVGNKYPETVGLRYDGGGDQWFWFGDKAPDWATAADDQKLLNQMTLDYRANITAAAADAAARAAADQLAAEQAIELQKQQAAEDAAMQRQYDQEQKDMEHQAQVQSVADDAAARQQELADEALSRQMQAQSQIDVSQWQAQQDTAMQQWQSQAMTQAQIDAQAAETAQRLEIEAAQAEAQLAAMQPPDQGYAEDDGGGGYSDAFDTSDEPSDPGTSQEDLDIMKAQLEDDSFSGDEPPDPAPASARLRARRHQYSAYR